MPDRSHIAFARCALFAFGLTLALPCATDAQLTAELDLGWDRGRYQLISPEAALSQAVRINTDLVRPGSEAPPTTTSGYTFTSDVIILADGIEALPEQMRIAVALHYNEGLKLKEVGEGLGLSESRVSRILDAARHRLRDYAQQRGY